MSDAFIWLLALYFGLQALASLVLIWAGGREPPVGAVERWSQRFRFVVLTIEAFFLAVVATALTQ